ncbi:pentapeptide repeat-containing protein [Leptolyngbyaceae cyanobacterium UHCC 1019]
MLEHVCWKDAQKLDRARLGNSILTNPSVRELLVTRNGYKKSYIDANLRTANLNGVNLEQANMIWADLTCADLRHANLKNANLLESLVLDTDFTGATLTGACLEAWNVDHNTKLDNVDCQYVYLLRNQQERRPSSGYFAPGEFTKLFQEVLSTVDLIFRNGIDWKAFVSAFKQVQVENEDIPLEIQSIQNKGDGVVVIRVSVPPDTNKEKIYSKII